MSIIRAFAPYEGEQPYLFASYAHADADKVLPVLTALDSGAGLDWSLLAKLPALSRVTVDETTHDAVLRALEGTDVTVTEIGG